MTNEKKLRELTDEELKQVNGGFTLDKKKTDVTGKADSSAIIHDDAHDTTPKVISGYR